VNEAARYCGMSIRSYRRKIQRGIFPKAIIGSRLYDLNALNARMDELSGLNRTCKEESSSVLSPYDKWKAESYGNQAR
jgi:hypothetical protein